MQVLDHEGDNHLGGKNFDGEVVDQLVLPRLAEHFAVDSFAGSNPGRRGDLAQLKHLAEQARIELSRSDDTILSVEAGYRPIMDDDGRAIECDVRLERSEVEQLIESGVGRTISLARELIQRNPDVHPSAVLMVGGPTQTPFVRQRVAAALGLRVDTSASPTTVVAEGAALFAGSRRVPTNASRPSAPQLGEAALELSYQSVTDDR